MFLDPTKLSQSSPAEILESAASGHLGLDHRFLHALIDRQAESLPAVLAFAKRDRSRDKVDLAPELIALFRHWKTSEAIPFLVNYIKEDPQDIPDEVVETVVEIGAPALDPLLTLYNELDESESGEIAFILANLHVRDERIRTILSNRLEYDLPDTVLLAGIYGDPDLIPPLQHALSQLEDEPGMELLKAEITEIIRELSSAKKGQSEEIPETSESFNIWSLYPEEADLPLEMLDEDERVKALDYPVAAIRAAAASSFFNRELPPHLRGKLLNLAQSDESTTVRARAWEALMEATEETEVVEAMLKAMRNRELPVEERGGLMVGLAPEADRNEVRNSILELYQNREGRAKALEAMWRSVHPSFREYFSKHLDDSDLEVRRGAIWGIGYYGLKSELDRLRKLFDDEELRSDALFAYTLALPADISRSRMKGLLARIERDARGLSEMEEELVKAALDERLALAGKEPFFSGQRD